MHPKFACFFILALLLFRSPFTLCAQQKVWQHYTAEDGLPSNEVYEVMQDSRGYLWFATEEGICSFNAYDFRQPVDTSIYHGMDAFVPAEDRTGRIWFGRLDATLWYIEEDTIRAWEYNAIPSSYMGKYRALDQLGIEDDGTVWMALMGLGLLVVDPDGNHFVIRQSERSNLTFTLINSKSIYAEQSAKGESASDQIDVIQVEGKNTTPLFKLNGPSVRPLKNTPMGIWPLNSGGFIFHRDGSLFYLDHHTVQWQSRHKYFIETMKESDNGTILLASHSVDRPGLYEFASLADLEHSEGKRHLAGHNVNYVIPDWEGGWWVATKDDGVYYCKNPALDVYDSNSGLMSDEVTSVTTNDTDIVYAAVRPPNIQLIDSKNGTVTLLPPGNYDKEISCLEYDPFHARLWCSDPLHSFEQTWNSDRWQFDDKRIGPTAAKRIYIQTGTEILYTSHPMGFAKVDNEKGTIESLGQIDTLNSRFRTFDVALDALNTIWVTTSDGLKIWRDSAYVDPPFDHPALRYQPHEIAFSKDGTMFIGLNNGILIRDNENSFIHLTEKDGLTSDVITKLEVTPSGHVYACTSAGFNFLTKADTQWHIQAFTKRHGLPSDEVNDITALNEHTWAATSKGLVRLKLEPDTYSMPAPIIETVKVNNMLHDPGTRLSLRHSENSLSIVYHALLFRAEGDILYRYRLHGADTSFTSTQSREVNFAQLRPGSYQFELQAQNTNRTWSESATYDFVIHPAWWQTWWFKGGLILGGFLCIWLFYFIQLRAMRRQNAIQNKMRDLETAALRAQMNPHFIFNCLNSIQDFIGSNDAEAATMYLGKFARLIRLALHSSVDGMHSLSDEVEMLESYLALEQLRFKNRFEYKIHVPPELLEEDIAIPPLLVQPLVENAIVHGMKGKANNGEIDITFSKKDGKLVVIVSDNGPGILKSNTFTTPKEHKSVGMTLTHHRLDLLSGEREGNTLSHENITDPDGHVMGSKVTLELPLN